MSQSNKPETVQADVIARHIAGQSNSKIARELGINRTTVAVILESADLGNYVKDGREAAISLIPKALDVVAKAIEAGNLKASLALLKGVGLFTDKLIVEEAKAIEYGDVPSYFEAANSRSADKPN